jgi:hypothetical protein
VHKLDVDELLKELNRTISGWARANRSVRSDSGQISGAVRA